VQNQEKKAAWISSEEAHIDRQSASDKRDAF
jgi:hypothetical protein